MKLLALVLALLVSTGALAGDWMVGTLASYHLERNGQNEFNPGLGGELELNAKWRGIVGFYDNSSNRLTVYGGAVRETWRWGPLRGSLMIAGASGYDAKIVPIAGPGLTLERQDFGVNVFFLPGAGGVFGLQLKVPWR